jgi:methionyl-tRNA formyltransferase
VHDKLAALAPEALIRALDLVAAGTAPRVPQDHSQATHVKKLEREDGHLDWSRSAGEIERLVRAFHPWPGTFCRVSLPEGGSLQLKVHRATPLPQAESCPAPGTVLEAGDRLLVACGSGVLQLQEVQLEGKKRLPAEEFLRGCKLQPGDRLA